MNNFVSLFKLNYLFYFIINWMNRMWKYEMTYLTIPFSISNFSELFNTPGISPAANLFKLRQYLYHVLRIKLRDVDFKYSLLTSQTLNLSCQNYILILNSFYTSNKFVFNVYRIYLSNKTKFLNLY